jgi:hypothetical protein
MIARKLIAHLAPAALLALTTLGLAACNGGFEREGERVDRGVKEDVRGMRDFFRDRGITVDTRLPER